MSMTACFQTVSANDLRDIKNDPALIESYADNVFGGRAEGEFCDIDKSWQTIHYLISGEVWNGSSPQAQVVLGGTEIGEDLGYGPARYHEPAQVQQLADSISDIDSKELAKRFDPEAMERYSLYAFSSEYATDELEMAQDYFQELKSFYSNAASRGDAILAFMV